MNTKLFESYNQYLTEADSTSIEESPEAQFFQKCKNSGKFNEHQLSSIAKGVRIRFINRTT